MTMTALRDPAVNMRTITAMATPATRSTSMWAAAQRPAPVSGAVRSEATPNSLEKPRPMASTQLGRVARKAATATTAPPTISQTTIPLRLVMADDTKALATDNAPVSLRAAMMRCSTCLSATRTTTTANRTPIPSSSAVQRLRGETSSAARISRAVITQMAMTSVWNRLSARFAA